MENEETKVNEEVKEEKAENIEPEQPKEEPKKEEEAKDAPKEEAKEEKPQEEPAPVNNKKGVVVPDIVTIEKLGKDEKPFEEQIEERRVTLFNTYTKSKRMSNISMLVVVAVVIGSFALIMVNQNWSKITGYVLAGVALVGMIVFSLLTKNKFPSQTKDYIRFVTTKVNQFVYNNTEFDGVQVDLNEKYNLTEISVDRVYKSCVDIGSRNIVQGKYMGRAFSCGELALYSTKEEGKRTTKQVAFIGKYVNLNNSLHFEDRYILNFKASEKENDLPTDIDDLVELHQDGNLVIYGKEGNEYAKDIPTKYIAALKKIAVEGHLLNLNVVLWAGHTGVYLSYDDPVVALPFDKPFEGEPQVFFKNNLLAVLEAQKIINK